MGSQGAGEKKTFPHTSLKKVRGPLILSSKGGRGKILRGQVCEICERGKDARGSAHAVGGGGWEEGQLWRVSGTGGVFEESEGIRREKKTENTAKKPHMK